MSYYLKNLLSESEKRRILNLHENRRKYEWKGLIMEATEEEAKSFFEKRKTKMKNFPPVGTVIDYDGKGNFAYKTIDANNNPLYLFADGTAKNSTGKTATNRWYGQLSPDEVALDKMPTLKPTLIEPKIDLNTLSSTPKGSEPQGMMTGKEINQSRRELKRKIKSAKKQFKSENKKNKQSCLAYFKNWVNDWNQKDEALQVIVKETSPQYNSYVKFLSSCCDILNENGKQPALYGLCSTKGVEPETIVKSYKTKTGGSGLGAMEIENQTYENLGLQ